MTNIPIPPLSDQFWVYFDDSGEPVYGRQKSDSALAVFDNGIPELISEQSARYEELKFRLEYCKKYPLNLHSVNSADFIWITDSEMQAELIADHLPYQECATTVLGGYRDWKSQYAQHFAGKRVLLFKLPSSAPDLTMISDLEKVAKVHVYPLNSSFENWVASSSIAEEIMEFLKPEIKASEDVDDDETANAAYPLGDRDYTDFDRRDAFLNFSGHRYRADEFGRFFRYADGVWKHEIPQNCIEDMERWVKRISLDAEFSNSSSARYESRKLSSIAGMKKVLRTVSEASTKIKAKKGFFENNVNLINFENGTLNVSNYDFYEHRPEDGLLNKLSCNYNPFSKCPVFESFIQDFFSGKTELIDYFQEVMGYFLTGMTIEPLVVVLYGDGKNGKSTFCSIIEDLTGSYSKRVRIQTFMKKSNSSIPNDLAGLVGKRVIIGSEMREDQTLDESLLKDLTGNDKISARFLGKEFFEFHPVGKILLYGNHRPVIIGTDKGIRRRLKMFHITAEFPEEKQDRFLLDKLRKELPGIANLCLYGLKRLQERNFKFIEPTELQNSVTELISENDSIDRFFTECGYEYTKSESDFVTVKSFYIEYLTYCRENGMKAISKPKFARYIHNRGAVTRAGTGNVQRYVYIRKINDTNENKGIDNHEN